MADEPIGSVSVEITGDYSNLEQSLNAAQTVAQQAGSQIADSFTKAAEPTDNLTESIKNFQEAAGRNDPSSTLAAALEALGVKFGDAGQSADTAGQGFSSAGDQAKKAGSDAQESAPKVENLGDAFKRVRNDAEAFEKAWGEALVENKKRADAAADANNVLTDSFINLAAGIFTAGAMKQFAEDAFVAEGNIQKLTTSLDLMGAGTMGAVHEVEQLKDLSVQLAVPFQQISDQAMRLSAAFGTGENMTAVLAAAGDAAAATGRDFGSVAQALERIEVTGQLQSRALLTLGLSWQQLADSMGVSIEEAQSRLKKGGQDAEKDVSDVINALNQKFAGAAEAQAQNFLGQLTILKNQMQFVLEQIGEDFGPVIPALTELAKIAATTIVTFIGGVKLAIDIVIGLGLEAITVFSTVSGVVAESAKGNFVMAASIAATGLSEIKANASRTGVELLTDAVKTMATLENISKGAGDKIQAAFTPSKGRDGGGGLSAEKYKQISLEIDTETAKQKTLIAIKRLGYQDDEKLGLISAEQNLARLQQLNNDELAIVQSGIQRKRDLQKQKGEGSKDAGLDKAEQAAEDAAAIKTVQLALHVKDAKEKFFDETVKDHVKTLNEGLKFDEDGVAHEAKLNDQMTDDRLKALALRTIGEEKHQVALLEMDRARVAFEQSTGQISASQRIAIDQSIDAEESKLQQKAIQREIDLLQAKTSLNTKEASEKQSLLNQLQSMQDKNAIKEQQNIQKNTIGLNEENDQLAKQIANYQRLGTGIGAVMDREQKRLQEQIQFNQLQGKASNSEIIALTNVQLRQQALITQTQIIGKTYSQMIGIVDQGFNTLGMNIGKVIVQGGDFWKTWHETLNNIEGQLLGSLISAVLKYAESWLITLILGKEAYGLAARTEIATSAAVAGAAAFASTAAIPIVGPALAPEAAAVAYGLTMAFQGLVPPLATGGMIPEDMLAMVHKGEYVVPATQVASNMAMGGGGNGETHIHFDFTGARFSNGLNDNQVKNIFDRGFRMSKLAGAFPPGRFPQ